MIEHSTERPDGGHAALNDALTASFRLLRWVMIGLVLAYLCSGLFVVRQHEKALVLRFGKIVGLGEDRVKGPGFHWTLPRPFSEIVRVPTERVQTLTTKSFWYRETEFQDESAGAAGPTLRPGVDGYTLTGDANVLHSRWSVRYTVDDPVAWVFSVQDGERSLLAELDGAVVSTTARYAIDRALRTDLEAVREAVESGLRQRVLDRGFGIRIQGVDLVAIVPPRQVAQSFDDVVQAEQERGKKISEARAYSARTVNEAQGQSSKILSEGQTARQRLIDEIGADADYFEQVYAKYIQNPDVVRRTLLQDTVRRTLAHVEQKYLVHSGADGAPQIRLQLSPDQKVKEPLK